MNQKLLNQIRACPTLPSFPAVALEVLRMTSDDESDLGKISEVIAHDAALTGRLLRMVNSSFFGLDHSISTIQHAAVILGMQSVKTLVLGLSVVPVLTKVRVEGFSTLKYWQRSLYAAVAARVLAQYSGVDKEVAFHAAMLMDVGMLAFDRVLGVEYGKVVAQARSHADLAALEKAALGMTHADATRVLAETWNLPDGLAIPMSFHDRVEHGEIKNDAFRAAAEVVSLASRCADVFADESSVWSIADVRRICMTRYNLDRAAADSLLSSIGRCTRELGPMFEIRLDDRPKEFETILERANRELLEMTSVTSQDASERRRAPRVKRKNLAQILVCREQGLGEMIEVQVQDVSARGIGFAHPTQIALGTQFVLQTSQLHALPVRLLYEVVRCTTLSGEGNARYHIGAELQCVLSDSAARQNDPAFPESSDSDAASIRQAVLS